MTMTATAIAMLMMTMKTSKLKIEERKKSVGKATLLCNMKGYLRLVKALTIYSSDWSFKFMLLR